MPDIRIHYSELLRQMHHYFNDKIMSYDSLESFCKSNAFKDLRSAYDFDVKNSETIDDFICTIISDPNKNFALYSNEIKNAIFVRIICLKGIFDAKHITSYLSVPSNLADAIPLVLVELWKSVRTFVELELEIH